VPALVWSARLDGSAEFFNKRWLHYAGLSAEEAMDWGWTVALHPDDRMRVMNYWTSVLASGEPAEIEARLRRFDGYYRWFLFRASPLRDPEDHKRIQELFDRCIIQKTDFDAQYRIVLPDGAIKHLHSLGHPVLDESGDLVEFGGTIIDITERKQAEEALRRSERDLLEAQ